jgi:hypothetical protein
MMQWNVWRLHFLCYSTSIGMGSIETVQTTRTCMLNEHEKDKSRGLLSEYASVQKCMFLRVLPFRSTVIAMEGFHNRMLRRRDSGSAGME